MLTLDVWISIQSAYFFHVVRFFSQKEFEGLISAQFNVCSPLFRHQETTKPAHSPTAVALCLPLFSVNNDLDA